MKTNSEKSSTTSTPATQTTSQPFFAKAGGGTFFEPAKPVSVPGVQLKMTVNKSGDTFEQEADRMADKVMRMPAPAPVEKEEKLQRQTDERLQKASVPPEQLQTKCKKCDEEKQEGNKETTERNNVQRSSPSIDAGGVAVSPAIETTLAQSKGGGQALPEKVNTSLGNAFGTDFSAVRVHTDHQAVEMNRQLNAHAFTQGKDIYFNTGQYNPDSAAGTKLLAHELTHTIQQGAVSDIQRKEEVIQLKPADYKHPEDGATVRQRMQQRIDQAPKTADAPDTTATTATSVRSATATPRTNQSARAIDPAELRKQKNALQGPARPDVNRPAQARTKVAQTVGALKQAVNKPATRAGRPSSGTSGGGKRSLTAADRAANVAQQAFSSAQSLPSVPQPAPPVAPPAIRQPVDSGGMPLSVNPDAEGQVTAIIQQVNALRMGGNQIRLLARQEHQNALVMRGNIQLVGGQLQQAEEGINQSNDHLAFRQDLTNKANQSLALSEQKATMVAAESPRVVAKANEGSAESGPMSSEAGQLASENASNTPDDGEAAADSREQGDKINQTGSDISTTDGAINQTRTRAERLGAEAAQAAQMNTQTRGRIDSMNQTLTQTGQKLTQMSGQTNTAKTQLNQLSSQPARLTQQAQQLDQRGLSLIRASQDLEQTLHRTQQSYRTGLQAIPKLRLLPQNEDGGTIQRQAASPSADADLLNSDEGRYEDRRNLDLTGRLSRSVPTWLTGVPDPASEAERERTRTAEEERRNAQIAEINSRAGGNFASLSAMDKMGIALRFTGRNLFGSVSNIKWPGWGHLAAGLIDPRGPMMGVVGGLSMMLSGGANLLSGEQWARDPIGNLLKSAADIATGLTIVLGSITALAGVIIAIMTAITILSFGFAAPFTGPIISFCATVMVTVGGWTIAVGKVALILQALVFIKNLIDAATARTAEQLQNNADQMTQDVSNAGNVVLQIGMAKLAQLGGRQLQSQITAGGGAVGFARAMPGRFAAGVRAAPGAIAGGIRAVGRGIAGGVRSVGGGLRRGYNWVRNRLRGSADEAATSEAGTTASSTTSGEGVGGTTRVPRVTELPPEDVSRLVVERNNGSFRLNRKNFSNAQKIIGEPEATVAEHAAREAYAAERAANMPNVERVYMGREADRFINPDVPLGSELSADVVGVTRQGRFVLIESKGTDISHGLEQLEHSAQALGREQIVRYELIVAEEIRTPGFSIRNGRLQLNGQPYLINGKPVHVRTTTSM